MDVLEAGVPWTWETFPEYMGAIGQRLGVNVVDARGPLRHPPLRDGRAMLGPPGHGRRARGHAAGAARGHRCGAFGLSITRDMNTSTSRGAHLPRLRAGSELFASAGHVLRGAGTGVIQCGGGTNPELKDGLLSRISQASGRPIMYEHAARAGAAAGRWQSTSRTSRRRRARASGPPALRSRTRGEPVHDEELPGVPRHADLAADPPGLGRREADRYRSPAMRETLRAEVDAPLGPDSTFFKRWTS